MLDLPYDVGINRLCAEPELIANTGLSEQTLEYDSAFEFECDEVRF
jgi:hypothetical protein